MSEDSQEIELIPEQDDALNSSAKYTATICGKRSGKTFVGALWAGHQISVKSGSTGLIAAPTYKSLGQAALDTFFKLYPEFKEFYRKQESVIELPDDTKIYIRSVEDPNSIEGLTVDWIWLDEAGQMKRDVWRIVRARVSTTKGQVFITTSPYSMNWLYYELYLPWKNKETRDTSVFAWRTIDNPLFEDEEGQEFIAGERKRLSPAEFAREYEGVFTKMTGLVWDLPEKAILSDSVALEKAIKYPDKVIGGLDFGFNNPAAIDIIVVKDAVYYLVDEWKAAGKSTAEIIEQCKVFEERYGVDVWFPDPAEPDRIEEMKRAGLHCEATTKDVKAGLTHVSSLIQTERFFVRNNCEKFLDEADGYHYKEGTDKPVKKNDHLCDAMRYAVMGYRPVDPVKRADMQLRRLERRKKRTIQRKAFI